MILLMIGCTSVPGTGTEFGGAAILSVAEGPKEADSLRREREKMTRSGREDANSDFVAAILGVEFGRAE
jgi:hypothetical protein